MLEINLDPELKARLEALARETGRTEAEYVAEAIREYLQDREDYLRAVAVLKRNEPTITLDELENRLGLAD